MDALIRAARVGPIRTRLKTAAAQSIAASHRDDAGAERARLREEVETEVRNEMAVQMQALCDVERERARAEGYAEGLALAQASAAGQIERDRLGFAGRVEGVLSALSQAHASALAQFESTVGEVSFAAVCRLVGREIASRSFSLGLVEQSSASLRADAVATVRLHPRDIDVLEDLLKGEALAVRSLGLRVIADEGLELGGCVVESASGDYDGGLESQLRRLHAILTSPLVDASPTVRPGEAMPRHDAED